MTRQYCRSCHLLEHDTRSVRRAGGFVQVAISENLSGHRPTFSEACISIRFCNKSPNPAFLWIAALQKPVA